MRTRDAYVLGAYSSLNKAIVAYDTLVMNGYPKDGFYLVANKDTQAAFPRDLDVVIRPELPQSPAITEEHPQQLAEGRFLLVVTESK